MKKQEKTKKTKKEKRNKVFTEILLHVNYSALLVQKTGCRSQLVVNMFLK